MDSFVIQGPVRLSGRVAVSGAKNAVLPAMTSALLAEGVSRLERVPQLRDTETMAHLLRVLGARVDHTNGTMRIDTRGYEYELVRPIPVMVTEGRVKGKRRSPILDYVPKPVAVPEDGEIIEITDTPMTLPPPAMPPAVPPAQ